VLRGEGSKAAVEQNFQFARDVEVEFRGKNTVATAPNGARLLLVPLSGGLAPELSCGDRTQHASYWPNGRPTRIDGSQAAKPPIHGRGWIGRRNKLLPAPAVTFTGDVSLPAIITLLLYPLPPERASETPPHVTRLEQKAGGAFLLPKKDGRVKFVYSADACSVEE
jgi:hypothetical protein